MCKVSGYVATGSGMRGREDPDLEAGWGSSSLGYRSGGDLGSMGICEGVALGIEIVVDC